MHLHLEGDYNMDKFKIKDRIDELKSAGEHGKVIKQKGGNKDKQTAAILRRSLRLKDVESGQSDAATMAGMKAFNQARQAGKDADAARTAQATASAEVRRASRAKQLKAKREDSHTVYEYIGAILAESLGLVEAVTLSSKYKKGREVDHTFTDSESGRTANITRQSLTTKKPEFTATTSRGRKLSGDKARRYFNKLMARRTPPKPSGGDPYDRTNREVDMPNRRQKTFGGRLDRYGRGPRRR